MRRTAFLITGFFVAVIVATSLFTARNLSTLKNIKNVGGARTDQPNEVSVSTPEASSTTSAQASVIVRHYDSPPPTLPADQLKNRSAVVSTAKGDIAIGLFGDEAPKTVSNFIFLASHQFYNGLTFHRRVEGFVIQGGDPNGNGTGGPGYKFEDEPVRRTYTRGIVAMANSGPNTNGSQFFIMLDDNPLPPNYTIFGKVTVGIDVVDKIQVGDAMTAVDVK